MNTVQITCDSTCDLTREQIEEFGIVSAPLYVRVDGGEYRDGVDITAKELFEHVAACGEPPKTAALSEQDYIDLWKPFRDAGKEIVHINISGDLSACHQNANLAAKELGGVYPVDSMNLSTGSGLLAIEGALMAKEGADALSIANALTEKRARLNVSFVLDTMDYLAKGGRCSSVTAFAAGLLKLRLCIEVKDGKMDVCKKYRGKMAAVLGEYVRDRLTAVNDVELDRMFITHSYVPDEALDMVKQAVLACYPFKNVMVSVAGCTISSHCGPKCLGILFFTK